jgi:ABC-type multidrug transport system ATPase subunit
MSSFANQLATLLSAEKPNASLWPEPCFTPPVAFADEPTANLDPNSVKHIEEIIRTGTMKTIPVSSGHS